MKLSALSNPVSVVNFPFDAIAVNVPAWRVNVLLLESVAVVFSALNVIVPSLSVEVVPSLSIKSVVVPA